MMNGSFRRLVLRRHHGVDEHQRQDEHGAQLIERLGLLFDFGARSRWRSPSA